MKKSGFMKSNSQPLPKSPSSQIASNGSAFLGIALMLVSGFGFTCSILFASHATRGGIDISTSNVLRYFVAAMLLWAWHAASGTSMRINPRERYAAFGLGFAVFLMGAGYLGATQYIPISLAVLIFYTGPFFIIIISRFTENEPITIPRLTAICIAFIGLVLALKVGATGSLPIVGILFAFAAAIGMASFVTVSGLAIRTASPQAVNLHSLVGGTLLFGLFLIVMGGPSGSITRNGLLLLIASGFSLAVGFITFFVGLKRIGPVRASILMNAEPVFTIILASILLGERLSPGQFAGAGLVVIGIVLITGLPDSARQRDTSL